DLIAGAKARGVGHQTRQQYLVAAARAKAWPLIGRRLTGHVVSSHNRPPPMCPWLVLVAGPCAAVRIRRVTATLPKVSVAARQDQQANLQKELIQPLVILLGHAAHPEEQPASAGQDGKGRSNAEEKRAPQGDDECAHHDK